MPLLPAARTFEGRTWKFIVTDLRTSRTLTAISALATDLTVTRLLRVPWPATAKVPADDPRINTIHEEFEDPTLDEPLVAEGIRCLIGFRDTGADPLWEAAYTGVMHQVADDVEDGIPVTKISAWDPRYYLGKCPVVKADGSLPGKNGLHFVAPANEIARTLLENLAASDYGELAGVLLDLDSGADEECAEVDITFQQGAMIGDAWTQLEDTGAIDIILMPVYDPRDRPGKLSVVNFYTQAGQERDATIFAWDRSPRSLTSISRLDDGTKRANVIQYFDANGNPVDLADDPDSITKYGPYYEQQAWPGQVIAAAVAALAIQQVQLRKNGQTTIGLSPAPQRSVQAIQGYDIGDRGRVEVSKSLRKPISGLARIYGVPITIGDDATETIENLIVSADQT